MNKINRLKKGVVLVTVVIFVLILSMLAISILFIMTNEARHTEGQIRRIRAHHAAQSAIHHYLELLKSNPTIGNSTLVIDGISVDVEWYDPPSSDPACTAPPLFQCECPQGANVPCLKARANY